MLKTMKENLDGTIFYIGDNRFVTNAHVILRDISFFVTPSSLFFL